MAKRQRKIATRCIVVGLLITSTSACMPTTNSTEYIEIRGTVDEVLEAETEVATVETKSETEKFQESYQAEMAMLSKKMGLPISDVSPYCDRGYVRTKTGESLNIRERPDASSKVLTQLGQGTIVRVVRKEDDFYRVVFQQEDKWQVGYATEELIEVSCKDILDYELIAVAVITANNSSDDRNYNLSLACAKLDRTVLKPDEKFDWYGDNGVGIADEKHGFKKATVLEHGQPVIGQGGGVCQVSTALYNCLLKLDLRIPEGGVYHHSKPSSYVAKGMDATVDYASGKSLIFYNNKDYSIYIEAYSEGGQVVVCLYKVI